MNELFVEVKTQSIPRHTTFLDEVLCYYIGREYPSAVAPEDVVQLLFELYAICDTRLKTDIHPGLATRTRKVCMTRVFTQWDNAVKRLKKEGRTTIALLMEKYPFRAVYLNTPAKIAVFEDLLR